MTDTHPSLSLSAIEQSGPRGYIRPLFFFSLEQLTDVEQNDVVSHLATALALTKSAIPCLSAEMIPDTESQQNGRFVLKPNPEAGKMYEKDLRGGLFPFTYNALREQHFPTSALPQDVLCPVPIFPTQAPIPVFAAQMTLIDGGLILNICIMHLVADARAIYEILSIWAQNCRHLQNPDTTFPCEQLPLSVFEKTQFELGLDTPDDHPEYMVFGSPPAPPPAMLKPTSRTEVYRFTPESLVRLKEDLSAGLNRNEHISTNDAVCALIWRCVLAAQVDLDEVSPEAISLNTICVDGRSRCLSPLPENHIGCPMVYATPGVSVVQMLAADSLPDVARTIRKAIAATDEHYIASLVGFLQGVHSYDCIAPASFAGLMDTNVMISSWFRVPFYDINWGPRFGHGKFDRVRTVHEGFFNGSQVIMPRLPTGEMEVVIGLDQAKWDKFRQEKLWTRYATVDCSP
ncbi:MAG: Molybdopterin binding oxidoreductase [Aureobasidium pullulans]|nr:MAG: Molybdopterin binding oxidoreductase [Aureobasidium pullulans]